MKKRINWPALVAIAGVLIVAFMWWRWDGWRQRAWIAAGFGARVACSCRYVEGRDLDSCRRDFRGLPGMALVHLSDDEAARRVEAKVPFLARRTAHAAAGYGCIIDGR